MRTVLIFLTAIFLQNNVIAQHGYIHFDANEPWTVSIDDSCTIPSDSILTLPVGTHALIARPRWDYNWPGTSVRDSLQISAGDTLTFKLRRTAPGMQPPKIGYTPPLQNVRSQFFKRNQPRYSKNLKRGILIGAIAANWIGFYLKRRADRYYSRYQSANSLSQIRQNYRRSQQFDNISSAFLGLSVSALGTYIYLIFTE